MLKTFQIENFRCLNKINIDKMTRVNLIVGPNNIGKTALLESLYILNQAPNFAETIQNILSFRGYNQYVGPRKIYDDMPWSTLFNINSDKREFIISGYEPKRKLKKISISLQTNGLKNIENKSIIRQAFRRPLDGLYTKEYLLCKMEKTKNNKKEEYIIANYSRYNSVELEQFPTAPIESAVKSFFYPAQYRAENIIVSEMFSSLAKDMMEESITESVRKIIEPNLEKIDLLYERGKPKISVKLKGLRKLLYLNDLGDGVTRVFPYLLYIIKSSNNTVYFDEIENGIYFNNLEKLWQTIDEVSNQYNTQIFATTHSRECVEAAADAFKGKNNVFSLIRLEHKDDIIKAVHYDVDTLNAARKMDLEFR